MKIFLLMLACILFITCSSKSPRDDGPTAGGTRQSQTTSIESKELASVEESNFVTEITFLKGEATMTKTAMDKIRNLHHKAEQNGKVGEVKVVTWADEEYPSVHKKKLSRDQRKLVKKRNAKVESYIRKLDDDAKIELFSMAERPSTIKKLFSSQDSRIKKSLETAGIPNTDTSVKVPGKASKSIVIFVMED